jgi:hypothetical protein
MATNSLWKPFMAKNYPWDNKFGSRMPWGPSRPLASKRQNLQAPAPPTTPHTLLQPQDCAARHEFLLFRPGETFDAWTARQESRELANALDGAPSSKKARL